MRKPIVARCARTCSFVVLITLSMLGLAARAQSPANADALLAIDQQRASVVERIVDLWGPALAKSSDYVSVNDLRERLLSLRADALFAASLAGTEEGLREVTGLLPAFSKTAAAQDFYAAFGLGADDRHIVTVDADGVSMAAIQGLHQLVQEKDARIDALEREMAELRQKVDDLIAHSR